MALEQLRATYTGSFDHAFDLKGRITVPAEWRDASFEPTLYIAPSGASCLRVYPASWMARLQDDMRHLKDADPQRRKLEFIASVTQSTTWDQQGRIMIREKLRSGAGLKKEAVLVGQVDHFKIWEKKAWLAHLAAHPPLTIEEALEALGR